jgi:hypothetical protein
MTISPGLTLAQTSAARMLLHRTGTSALSRLLNVLGAELPEQLVGPERDNPLGHWEPLRLVKLDDEMLAAIGRHWDDPQPIPRRWFRSQAAYLFQQRLADAIASAYGDAALILIKNPRICRLALGPSSRAGFAWGRATRG